MWVFSKPQCELGFLSPPESPQVPLALVAYVKYISDFLDPWYYTWQLFRLLHYTTFRPPERPRLHFSFHLIVYILLYD